MSLLLKILRPKKISRRHVDWTWRHHFYRWILKRMCYLYKFGAVHDVIQLGKIKCIHNIRDEAFENELKKFDVEAKIIMRNEHTPYNRAGHFVHFHFFKWTETLTIYNEKSEYCVTRNTTHSVSTNMLGEFRTSEPNSILSITEFIENNIQAKQQKDKPTRQSSQLQHERHKESVKTENIKPVTIQSKGTADNTILKRGKINIDLTF
ncbi:hypothetical protein [Pseudobutyrivibrio sp.]|uniref:hypothetical protein n=1 Tax=Pseudobutyrivibrio sp. TaxID=2014367 RepID=UPI0038631BC4